MLYGFTYKYLPLEQFLGQLTRLAVGQPLAEKLAQRYSQVFYPGDSPLFIPSTGSGQASRTGTSSPTGRSTGLIRGTLACGDG